jgi:putative ABC transport system ATP-binding protein
MRNGQLSRLRREKIGFVFQHYNLIPTLTALENVSLPLSYAGVSPGARQARARLALAQVGMVERERHRPAELSGGEQQRVAIARAFVNRPAIVIADEPTGELDSNTARDVMKMIRRLNEEDGHTIIVVTHDPLVANETKRIVRLNDGHIESDVQVA